MEKVRLRGLISFAVMIVLCFLLVWGVYAQTPGQLPLTKEQITERLQNVRIEMRWLQLQSEEKQLVDALKNMEAAKVPEKAEKKK
jgi:hypothetical protein